MLGIIAWGQRNQYLAETHVRATAQANAISEANARGTAQAEAISEANARATQESIAIAQKNEAVQQAKIAIAGALDTNSTVLLAKQIDLALLLSLEGYRFSPGPKTSGAMLNALLASSRLIRELHGTQSTVGSIAYSPDGKLLATDGCGLQNADFTCAYSETDLWNAQTGELVGKLTGVPQSAAAIGITFSPDSQQLLTFNRQGNVVIWDLETWQPVDKIKWHDRYVTAIAVQPGGRLVALGECTLSVQGVEAQFGCEPGLIELWDTTTHQPLNQTLTGNPGTISSLAFSPDGKYLAAGDYKGQLVLWNLQTGASQTIGDLGNVNFVNALAFSPDSGTLLAVDTTDKISFIDVVTGKSLKRSIQLPGSFASMAISPDGKILVTASCSNGTGIKCSTEVTFWDALTGIQIGQPLKGYSDYIPNLAFSPDGSTLALETIGEIQLYDLTSGQVIGPAITGMEVNGAIQFSPDGKTLASGRPVTLWAIDPAAWIAQACQIANRNLTQDEWQTYLGDQPYHQTCVNIP